MVVHRIATRGGSRLVIEVDLAGGDPDRQERALVRLFKAWAHGHQVELEVEATVPEGQTLAGAIEERGADAFEHELTGGPDLVSPPALDGEGDGDGRSGEAAQPGQRPDDGPASLEEDLTVHDFADPPLTPERLRELAEENGVPDYSPPAI